VFEILEGYLLRVNCPQQNRNILLKKNTCCYLCECPIKSPLHAAPTWTHSFCYQIQFSQIQFGPSKATNFSTKSPHSYRITREVSTGQKGDARNSKALSFIRWRLIIDTVLGLLLTSKKCCHVALAKQQMPKKRKSKDAKHFVLCRPGTKRKKMKSKGGRKENMLRCRELVIV